MKKLLSASSVLFLSLTVIIGCVISPTTTTTLPTVTTTTLPVPTVTNTTPLGWTIMVYMCGDNNLEEYALSDLNEMEAASTAANLIDVVVLMDRSDSYTTADGDWTGTRLYKVTPDSDRSHITSTRLAGMGLSDTGDADELNMANPVILSNFVEYCRTNYPATHTALVIWDHGDGWRSDDVNFNEKSLSLDKPEISLFKGAVSDDTGGFSDYLYNYQIHSALTGQHLDVLAFDACLMGMVEVAAEFADVADCLIASPESIPGDGYPYDYWLAGFANTSGSVEAMYSVLIDEYAYSYRYYSEVTLAAYDLTKTVALLTALDNYAQELIDTNGIGSWVLSNHTNPAKSIFDTIAGTGMLYAYTSGLWYEVDPYRLAEMVTLDSSAALMSAVDDFVLDEWHQYDATSYSDDSKTHGIALFFGDPATMGSDMYNYTGVYTNLAVFNSASKWIDIVRAFFELPPYTIMVPATAYHNSIEQFTDVYYQFRVDTAGSLTINLTPGSGCDDYMFLIYNGVTVDYSWNTGADVSETIDYTATDTGWYCIIVKRWDGSDTPQFTLTVTEGTADIY